MQKPGVRALCAGQIEDAILFSQIDHMVIVQTLYVDPGYNPNATGESISQIVKAGNETVSSVIGTYSDGERVKVFNETPVP